MYAHVLLYALLLQTEDLPLFTHLQIMLWSRKREYIHPLLHTPSWCNA